MQERDGEGNKRRYRSSSAKARYVGKRWAAGGACREIPFGYNVKATFPNVRRTE